MPFVPSPKLQAYVKSSPSGSVEPEPLKLTEIFLFTVLLPPEILAVGGRLLTVTVIESESEASPSDTVSDTVFVPDVL